MAISIDATGINIDTLPERIDELNTDYKGIYGEDINLDQDTPDGQVIGIHAKLDIDIQEGIKQIYDSRDPDTAVGVSLDVISKLSGLTRNAATKSTVNLDITTSQDNVTLPADYTVEDDLSQNWIIEAETTIATAGTESISFIAQDWGAVEAQINTIESPVTIIIGVDTVTNPAAATVGLDEETDEDYRIRRARGTEKPSHSSIGAITASLFNDIDNVADVRVAENDTDSYDAVLDLNARRIWVVVEGGTDNDIAEVISKQKTLGAGLKGSETGTYTETISNNTSGLSRTITYTRNFDRPTLTNIYIEVTLTKRNPTDVIDEQAVKNSLIGRTFIIGEDALVTDLYSNVYAGGTNFTASALQLSKDDIVYETEVLSADFAEKFVITDANIDITVV